MSDTKPVLHVEVVQKAESNLATTTLRNYVLQGLQREKTLAPGTSFHNLSNELLLDHVEYMRICERSDEDDLIKVHTEEFELNIHIFKLEKEGAQTESIESGDGDGEEVSAASHWVLPSRDFHGLWEHLVYESNIKNNLLHFMETTLLFSDKGVNSQVITWNRVILLHGPPGTGKTSLCRALAQKLTIRMSDRYTHGQLLEINSHSLFSKWFSESGKLVQRMFSKIQELIENPSALVVVLIDEVESLTHARNIGHGHEPSDSIRTVNAVLTQIDNLKRYPNVLILTTSNVTGAIDLAFVDRADIKQYIGPPPISGIYKILSSCIDELSHAGIISPSEDLVPFNTAQLFTSAESKPSECSLNSLRLLAISRDCLGLSGRTLRKLPFLAHALYVQNKKTTLTIFLEALQNAVTKHKTEIQEMGNSVSVKI